MYTVDLWIRLAQVEYGLEIKMAKHILLCAYIFSICLEVADLGGYSHIG